MVAGKELVGVLSQFMVQLKIYGVIFERSMDGAQRRHFIDFINANKDMGFEFKQHHLKNNSGMHHSAAYFVSIDDVVQAMREDLSVVEGDVENLLERFIEIKYNHYLMMKPPNVVDRIGKT